MHIIKHHRIRHDGWRYTSGQLGPQDAVEDVVITFRLTDHPPSSVSKVFGLGCFNSGLITQRPYKDRVDVHF
jgi:hypothetical protein